MNLEKFVEESYMIEGLSKQDYSPQEWNMILTAHRTFLQLDLLTSEDIISVQQIIAPSRPLRDVTGLDVFVGSHRPLLGGPEVRTELMGIVSSIHDELLGPYRTHIEFENLHPFMDGNGRVGRLIWLWMMRDEGVYVDGRSFLHHWYYQSLECGR